MATATGPTVPRWIVAAVVLVALGARLAVMLPRIGREADDPDSYLPLARAIAAGKGFSHSGFTHDGFSHDGRPTAYRPPLYPMMLAPLVGRDGRAFSAGIAALHLAIGAATVLMTAATVRRWGLSPWRQVAAALIVALDPVLVVQSRSVMTETLAAGLLAAAILATTFASWRGAVATGVAFGLASLCRPSTLPAAALFAVLSVLADRGSWKRSVLMVLAVVATLVPWAIRNAVVLGEPVWTTTHGGYTLALANNPEYYRDVLDGPPGAVWGGSNQKRWFDRISRETGRMPEPEADRRLRDSALSLMRERPRDAARASLARLGRLWALAPSAAVYGPALRLASAAWTLPFWIVAALGLARPGWRSPTRLACPAIVAAITIVHLFYWTDMRMRAPMVPALALIAATGPFRGPEKIRKKSGFGANRAVQTGGIG